MEILKEEVTEGPIMSMMQEQIDSMKRTIDNLNEVANIKFNH